MKIARTDCPPHRWRACSGCRWFGFGNPKYVVDSVSGLSQEVSAFNTRCGRRLSCEIAPVEKMYRVLYRVRNACSALIAHRCLPRHRPMGLINSSNSHIAWTRGLKHVLTNRFSKVGCVRIPPYILTITHTHAFAAISPRVRIVMGLAAIGTPTSIKCSLLTR